MAHDQQPDALPPGQVDEHLLEGSRSNGDVVRFDHRTGTLGVYRGDVIIAWFRPDEGHEMFLREVAK